MEIRRACFSIVLPTLCLFILVSGNTQFRQLDESSDLMLDANALRLHRREAPGAKLGPGGKCKPGDKWKLDDCNNCICTHTGYASCSLNDCSSKKRKTRETPSGKISPSGRCKPGDKWKLDECNSCHCTHTGYASCTLNECSPKKKEKRAAQPGKVNPTGKCKPGDKWQLDECNSCVCTHTGYASCSLNDCKDKKNRGKRSASIGKPLGNSGNECRAGHSWKENCNSCFCSERGIAMCTDMACPTPPPPKNYNS